MVPLNPNRSIDLRTRMSSPLRKQKILLIPSVHHYFSLLRWLVKVYKICLDVWSIASDEMHSTLPFNRKHNIIAFVRLQSKKTRLLGKNTGRIHSSPLKKEILLEFNSKHLENTILPLWEVKEKWCRLKKVLKCETEGEISIEQIGMQSFQIVNLEQV